MENLIPSIIWRRLDTPGHDACRLTGSASAWQIEGTAVFSHEGVPAKLSYRVMSDLGWHTQQGEVHGWFGGKTVDFLIARNTSGEWTMNGAVVPGLEDCIDLDFGFTPATNFLQLRRLALPQGQGLNAPVAWLDASMGTLEFLDQRYERRTETTYWYEVPRFEYAAMLEVTLDGFIARYPGLWEAEL
ncbi:MAG: hypothetical protein CVU64_01780 [Deltaproteobacteria bacterium HGW-Deltaproteobacteria-21]|nr:MAG: hypothetical protein CVU64_01780 [Deltaproteobacteria bacterium HGW-Deltaproteobacteria-21]